MKQFDENEVGAILKRAADNSSRDDPDSVGLTVEELEQLASDTGIDPEQNSAQVTAVKEAGKTKISVLWNGPLTALPYYIPVPLAAIVSLLFASEFLELSAVPGFSFVLLVMALTFFAGRWALTRRMENLFAGFNQMFAEFQLPSTKSGADPDVVPNLAGAVENDSETGEPLLKLDGPEAGDKSNVHPSGRARSRE